MFKVNDAKSQTLLKGLQTDPNVAVSIADFNAAIRQSGVEAKIQAGRKNLTFDFDLNDFGINSELYETKDFANEHFSSNTLRVLPEKYEKALKSAYDKARYSVKKRSYMGDNFVSIDEVDALKEDFLNQKGIYFDTLSEIMDNWLDIISDFKSNLINMLRELALPTGQRDLILERVFDNIPTGEEYEKSFYFDLKLKAFPVIEVVDGFDAGLSQELAESTEDDLLRAVYGSIAHSFNEIVDFCNRVIDGAKKGLLNGRQRLSAEKLSKSLAVRNVFKNPEIEKINSEVERSAMYKK